MSSFTPLPALAGGALIGLAATSLLLTNGRIAGVSGLLGGLFERAAPDRAAQADGRGAGETRVRLLFLAGLAIAGLAARLVSPPAPAGGTPGLLLPALAGLLVGVGTQVGSGCTSGHGVCGLARLSGRSLAATLTFLSTGVLTVAALRALGALS